VVEILNKEIKEAGKHLGQKKKPLELLTELERTVENQLREIHEIALRNPDLKRQAEEFVNIERKNRNLERARIKAEELSN
jgi:hypothetical protein